MMPSFLTTSMLRWAGAGVIIAILIGAFVTLKIQRDSARNDATRERLRAEKLESAYLTMADATRRQNAAIDALGKSTAEAREKGRQAGINATATGIKADARILSLTNYKRIGSDCEDAKHLLLDYQEGRL